jgi:aminoglycoside phosphotransferase (APT) family kinase protein
MDVVELEHRVEAHFRARADRYGLDPEAVRATYRLNPGGFVNASYRVSDGRTSLFLKLNGWTADDDAHARHDTHGPAGEMGGESLWPGDDTRAGLRRWHQLAGRLTAEYHAPRVIDRVELEGGYQGLLFEWIEGDTPGRLTEPLSTAMFAMLARLHSDHRLAQQLPAGGTCADAYLGNLHDRYVEDLAHIERHRPPFIGAAKLAWMRAQAAGLETIVTTSAAFREPANSPVHGDLWLENVLVTASGQWYLLDWDGLRQGDPVADLATLLGPSRTVIELTPLPARVEAEMADAARQRFQVYRRAVVLDWIIDPLADWIEAAGVPAHRDAVRAEKRAVHEAACALHERLPG